MGTSIEAQHFELKASDFAASLHTGYTGIIGNNGKMETIGVIGSI